MSALQNEKSPTGRLSISGNIHIDGVKELQITTLTGVININGFVLDCLAHHQELLVKYDALTANDYPELDYGLHKTLMAKELRGDL